MANYTETDLISKKDLLSRYGISYGALYRWKRKGLIPEDWFIKKSTVTGQETFFPAQPVCSRIELILRQKEDVLLDELASKLNEQQKSNTAVVISTVFGEKSFLIEDIKAVFSEINGVRSNITEKILQLVSSSNQNPQ